LKLYLIQYIDRSGSSFLVNQLSLYNDVYVFPEAGYLGGILFKTPNKKFNKYDQLYKKLSNDYKNHFQLRNWPINQVFEKHNFGKSYYELFLELLRAIADKEKVHKSIWIFKFQYIPGIVEHLKEISNTIIEIKIIFLLRDPRAIFFSQKNIARRKLKLPFSCNPVILSLKWNYMYKELMQNINNPSLFCQKYEDLVINFNKSTQRIEKFLAIDGQQKSTKRKYFNHLSEIERKIHSKINSPPDIVCVDAWKTQLSLYYISYIEKKCFPDNSKYEYIRSSSDSFTLFISRIIINLYFKLRILLRIDNF
jgi:hypothetical protein